MSSFISEYISTKEIKDILSSTKIIAVIGLSPNEYKDSNMVAKYLQNNGFKVVPIYPKEDKILGEKVYRSISEVPFKLDMLDVFRRSSFLDEIVNEAIKRGDIDTIWTQFNIINDKAMQKALDCGIKVVQNRCTKVEYRNLF